MDLAAQGSAASRDRRTRLGRLQTRARRRAAPCSTKHEISTGPRRAPISKG